MRTNLIVATGINGEIGKDNDLLWKKQRADMAMFKTLTNGATVVMGRNTWESIPEKYRPLPNRINIVVSTTLKNIEGAIVVASIEGAIDRAKEVNTTELWFMGGERIYEEAIRMCDRLSITMIHKEFPDADVFLEEAINPTEFGFELVSSSSKFSADDGNEHDYTFEMWEKVI